MASLVSLCTNETSALVTHIMLVPACISIAIIALWNYHRTKQWCLLVPFNHLVNTRRKYVMIFSFGSMANALVIKLLPLKFFMRDVHWVLKPFVLLLMSAEVGLVYYPLFSCRYAPGSELLNNSIGVVYTFLLIVRNFLDTFAWNCVDDDSSFVWHIFMILPQYICTFAVLFLYSKPIFNKIRKPQEHEDEAFQIATHNHVGYVRQIFKTINSSNESILLNPPVRKKYMWKNVYHFKYSPLILSVSLIVAMYFYQLFLSGCLTYTEYFQGSEGSLKTFYIIGVFCFIASLSLCIGQFLRFLVCHRNNLLKTWKRGLVKSGLKSTLLRAEVILYRNLSFAGSLVAITITSTILQSAVMFIIQFLIFALIERLQQAEFVEILKLAYSFFAILVIIMTINTLLVKFFFHEKMESPSGDFPSVKNVKGYHMALYFTFFGNLVMGFWSSVFRLLLAGLINLITLSRVDLCIFNPKYLLIFDRVYRLYLSYLKLSAAYENPTMRTFCQILIEEQRRSYILTKQSVLPRTSRKSLNRWHLAVLLINNPTLQSYRRQGFQSVNDYDVNISV